MTLAERKLALIDRIARMDETAFVALEAHAQSSIAMDDGAELTFEDFCTQLDALDVQLPDDYRFDREEANMRR